MVSLRQRAVLRQELRRPQTNLGRRYLAVLVITIVLSVLYLFLQEEYPSALPLGSVRLLLFELTIFLVFAIDFVLRLLIARRRLRDGFYLAVDFLATLPSAFVLLHYVGVIGAADLEFLALLRLFRLARILKLLRMHNAVVEIFGTSVLTLVFGVMTFHLGLRVLLQEALGFWGGDISAHLDSTILMIGVTAVGSVFGIALAITFGIAQRKQIEISELHRLAMDALDAVEADIRHAHPNWSGTRVWRQDVVRFLNEEISYPDVKRRTVAMLAEVREQLRERPSMDVPYHGLVGRVSQFLTKTQIEFHPVFYKWLNRIAQLYFVLVLLAAPGLTGAFVQLMVIFVFQGLERFQLLLNRWGFP